MSEMLGRVMRICVEPYLQKLEGINKMKEKLEKEIHTIEE